MMSDPMLLGLWAICQLARIPRIVERWKAPFLNGPGWFFGVQVPDDFMQGAGSAILARYRTRLFLPCVMEFPIAAVLFLTGHATPMLLLVIIVTLLTRLGYYANRNAAEQAARPFQIAGSNAPAAGVSLSLEPRSLRTYTNPWIEAAIATGVLASAACFVYGYLKTGDRHALRGAAMITSLMVYTQLGLLLMKRGFVRARSVVPAEQAESYLQWRESLRRLSTTTCDCMRLGLLWPVLTVALTFVFERSRELSHCMPGFALLTLLLLGWYEWRIRLQHLRLTRATRPTGFLTRPDAINLASIVCFRPSLPVLLLKRPNGYALNLASTPARTGALYFAGCALLLTALMHIQ